MEKLFRVNILTGDKTIYQGEVFSLIAPAELGYLGVLANHAPIIANLVPGKITLKENSGRRVVIISKSKGFLEVLKNRATILLDRLEAA